MSALAFLNKKYFHPGRFGSIEKVWEAEQKDAYRKQQEEDAILSLKAQEQGLRRQEMLEGNVDHFKSSQLSFMYSEPPGFRKEKESSGPEEDAKVEEFNRYMTALKHRQRGEEFSSSAKVTKLQEQLGVRPGEIGGKTYAELQQNFPELKNAPILGEYAKDIKLNFKPFGKVLHHIRCPRCKQWGHANSTDKECPMHGAPNLNDLSRLEREDPLATIAEGVEKRQGGPEKLVIRRGGGERTAGADDYHLFVTEDDAVEVDTAFLGSLSKKEKRRLLKKLCAEEKRMKRKQSKQSSEGGQEECHRHKRRRSSEGDSHRESKRRRKSKSHRHRHRHSGEGRRRK